MTCAEIDDGTEKPHPLNDPRHAAASILVVGSNFGCGSSREHPSGHLPLGVPGDHRWGFSEIFFGNCTALGIPCVTAAREDVRALSQAIEANPSLPVVVDVERRRVFLGLDGAKQFPVHMPDTARDALISGRWDPIADLLEGASEVAVSASRLDYMQPSL